jgi:hypothetical protein
MGITVYPLGDNRLEIYVQTCGDSTASASVSSIKRRSSVKENMTVKRGFGGGFKTFSNKWSKSYDETAKTTGDLMVSAMRDALNQALGNTKSHRSAFITQAQASICWKMFCKEIAPDGIISLGYQMYNMSQSYPLNENEFDVPIAVEIKDGVMAEVVNQ